MKNGTDWFWHHQFVFMMQTKMAESICTNWRSLERYYKFQFIGTVKNYNNPLDAKNNDSASEKWAIVKFILWNIENSAIQKTIAAHTWVQLPFW